MGYYVHALPGRLRLKLPALKRRPRTAADIRQIVESCPGVESVALNSVTGSLVVNYDNHRIDSQQIMNVLQYEGFMDSAELAQVPNSAGRDTSRAGEAFGQALFNWAVGRVLDASGLSFLSALI